MPKGVCLLCNNVAELCESHALPNSAFNYIFRKSAGKAIVITDDAITPTHHSSDSWKIALLCADCESKLNLGYDRYGIDIIRGHIARTKRGQTGITFANIDRQRLRMFFLSILWRISISSHVSYSNIDLPHELENELRNALLHGHKVPTSRFNVAIYRLHDSTGVKGFSPEDLRNFIMAPFAREYKDFVSVCYPFLGFFVEIFLNKLPKKYANRPSVLSGKSSVFMAPYQEVLNIPEIMNVLVRGLEKEVSGLSQIK